MQVMTGTRLGPYEISARIGAGGMGEVWRAKDTRLDRSVAVKVLPAELAHSAQLKLRFEREAKTISQLNHPNICTLYDVGENYLVMELLEGETLAERLVRGPLPLPDVLRFGVQIAEALDRAHRAGIVHRDLKPGNVMITRGGAKLLDFGLARNEMPEPAINADGTTQQHPLTEEGMLLGTFQYMAPEQLEGITEGSQSASAAAAVHSPRPARVPGGGARAATGRRRGRGGGEWAARAGEWLAWRREWARPARQGRAERLRPSVGCDE